MPLPMGGSHRAAVLFALVLQQGKSTRKKFFSVCKESGQRRGRVYELMFQSKKIHYWLSK